MIQWMNDAGFSVADYTEGSAMVLQESDGLFRITLVFNDKNLLLTGLADDTSARRMVETFVGLFRAN